MVEVEYFDRLSSAEVHDRRFRSRADLGTYLVPAIMVRLGGASGACRSVCDRLGH